MPKAQMEGKTTKLSDRQRLQAVIKGDPKLITAEHCCRAAYYVKEEANKTEHGRVAIALVRSGHLDSFLKLAKSKETIAAVQLAKMVEHMEGPLSGVTHDCLLQAETIFMKQEKK